MVWLVTADLCMGNIRIRRATGPQGRGARHAAIGHPLRSVNIHGKAFGILETSDWTAVIVFIKTWAGNFLVVSLAGVGLSTDFRKFKGLGFKPFFVGLGAALSVGFVSYLAISLLGSMVAF